MRTTTDTTIKNAIFLLALFPLLLTARAADGDTANSASSNGADSPAMPERPPSKEMILDLGDGVTMKLVRIPAGKFLMGSPADEKGRWPEEGVAPADAKGGKTQVEVTISKPFHMGVYPVTMEQFQQFVKQDKRKVSGGQYGNANRRTPDPGEEKLPATWMKMDDALAFCEWLSAKSGKKVLLPTEAQWEYACRAGTTTRFWFGDKDEDLYKYGNYCDKNEPTREKKGTDRDYRVLPWRDMEHDDGFGSAAPVGSYKPNPWGLYDMHGNVWQFCRGWSVDNYYPATGTVDPAGPGKGYYYAMRGGSFTCRPSDCRSASRERRDPWNDPHNQWPTDGFRVIVEEESPASAVNSSVGQEPGKRPMPTAVAVPQTGPLPYKVEKLPELVLDLGDGMSMKFLKVPPGKWTPPKGKDGKEVEAIEVGTFYLAVYEVTDEQFKKSKVNKLSPSYPQIGKEPATNIAGLNAFKFCTWMSEKTGKLVRLPTLAEWQHAVRAGTTTKYYFGDDASEMYKYANGCDRACSRMLPERDMRYWDGFDKTAPVGSFPPNPWGFHDMLGNVSELTTENWPTENVYKGEPMISYDCGGNWRFMPSTSYQGGKGVWHDYHYEFYGFRVAVSVDPKTGETMPALPTPAAGGAKN